MKANVSTRQVLLLLRFYRQTSLLSYIIFLFQGAVVLLPLLGISWIFGLFAYKSYALSLIFVLLNSIQGVAIFLIYCVLNNEVSFQQYERLLFAFVSVLNGTVIIDIYI